MKIEGWKSEQTCNPLWNWSQLQLLFILFDYQVHTQSPSFFSSSLRSCGTHKIVCVLDTIGQVLCMFAFANQVISAIETSCINHELFWEQFHLKHKTWVKHLAFVGKLNQFMMKVKYVNGWDLRLWIVFGELFIEKVVIVVEALQGLIFDASHEGFVSFFDVKKNICCKYEHEKRKGLN